MLRGKVVREQGKLKIKAEIQFSPINGELSTESFLIDTGCTSELVRPGSEFDSYDGRISRSTITLADGSWTECSVGWYEVRMDNVVRPEVQVEFLGPINMIGMEFLKGAKVSGQIALGSHVEFDIL